MNEAISSSSQIREINIILSQDPAEPTFALAARLADDHVLIVRCLKIDYAAIESFVKTLDTKDPQNYEKLTRYLRSQGFKESFKE